MTRRHFNQILRIRRAVPPAQVMKIPLRAHVLPEGRLPPQMVKGAPLLAPQERRDFFPGRAPPRRACRRSRAAGSVSKKLVEEVAPQEGVPEAQAYPKQ